MRAAPAAEIYLDWNATTPPLPEVVAAMCAALDSAWGNPASVHRAGQRARAAVERARAAVAELVGVNARDVVFVSGATEANNLALHAAPGLVVSRLEHPSVLRVAEARAAQGTPVRELRASPAGRVDPDEVYRLASDLPPGSVVALSAVNHETGVVQPVAEVAAAAARAGARLHVDAAQAAGKLDRSRWGDGDTVSLSAHKLRGPKGIGVLAWRCGQSPVPLLLGGGQERGMRPGTVDPVAAAGFEAAVRWAGEAPRRYARLAVLRDRIEQALSPPAVVNGVEAERAPHITNLSVPGWRGDELVAALDLEGIRVSSGSACSAGTAEASEVIRVMAGPERALQAVRISLGDDTGSSEVDRAIDVILRVLERQGSSR